MKMIGRIAILTAVAGLAAAAVLTREGGKGPEPAPEEPVTTSLPKVVDLGSQMCIPCQTMMTELDRLADMTMGTIDIEFIDINENQTAAQAYGIRVIPTQIFISETGEELWRHEGVLSAEDMVAAWAELGYDVIPEEPVE
ncbi:MAG: thioredoxin family protein [Candidatus Fermentibacter sp.]|nr:thioredoxin family protein [Candidatus Fermentibacter sp.]